MSITGVVVDANYFGILIDGIDNHSNLSNVTVKCDICAALTVTARQDTHSCHVNIRDVTVTGGDIKIENVYSHLSVSNVKAMASSVYQYYCTNLLIYNCGSNMSITDVVVDHGKVSIIFAGSHSAIRNVIVKTPPTRTLTLRCYGIFINGSSNSNHVKITGIRAMSIIVSEISSNLDVDNIYTDGLFHVSENGNNITVRNITVRNTNDNFYLPQSFVARCGSYISISNVTIYNGVMSIMGNRKDISLQNITIYGNVSLNGIDARKIFGYTGKEAKLYLAGLMVGQNYDYIVVKNIKIFNSLIFVGQNGNYITITDIYLISYLESDGVTVGSNKNNIILSDIIVDGDAKIYITNNGNNLTVKNRIQTSQFAMAQNENNISLINVTAANNTNLHFQSNGDNITLNNVTINRVFTGCGLVFLYNKGSYSVITLINVTVSECHCGIYAYGQSLLNFTSHPSSFINNTSVNNGAGMQIGGGIILSSSVNVYFINNTAHGVGGAIYVDVNILKIENLVEICTFQNFTPIFVNNTAVVAGNDVYNGKIWKCRQRFLDGVKHDRGASPFIEAINCSSSIFLKGFPTPLSSHVTSTPIGVCLCTDNGTTDCYKRSIHEQLYPGQYISLPLVTVGMCGGISPAVLVITNTSTLKYSSIAVTVKKQSVSVNISHIN